MSTRGFLIEILPHHYNAGCTEVISGFYSLLWLTIIRTFSQNIYCFLIHFQAFLLIFLSDFINYSLNHMADNRKWGSPHFMWIFFHQMYLIREILLRYKTNSLLLTSNHAKESFSSKNSVSLLNQNCEQKKRNKKFVQKKLISKIK